MYPPELQPEEIELPPTTDHSIVLITFASLRHERFAYRMQQEFGTSVRAWFRLNHRTPRQYAEQADPSRNRSAQKYRDKVLATARTARKYRRDSRKLSLAVSLRSAVQQKVDWLRFARQSKRAEQKLFADELARLKRDHRLEPRDLNPADVATTRFVDELRKLDPYFFLSLGGPLYGRQILESVRGCPINQHAGHSPDYKGAHTIEWALYHRDLAHALLRFYWFRLSDAMVPAAAAVLAAMIAVDLAKTKPRIGNGLVAGLCLLAAVGLGIEYWKLQTDIRPKADAQTLPTFEGNPEKTERVYRDWRAVCSWVRENTPEDALFLTPRRQQTFKWYAQRKEVVSWKDIPQDAAGIVDWWERFGEVHAHSLSLGGLAARSDEELRELAEKYGADYVIIDRTFARRPIGLKKVYPRWPAQNETYAVYRFEREAGL